MTASEAGTVAHCVVSPANHGASRQAARIADELGLPLANDWRTCDADVALVIDVDRAGLQLIAANPPGPIFIDFASPTMEHRRKGGQNELLGRAVGVRKGRLPKVFDATAGLGRDGFVLADLGCTVTLAERSPVLGWLLGEAVVAAKISASEHVRVAGERLSVVTGDSTTMTVAPESVIYLDPMFTDRKSSAAVKKDLTVLQALHDGLPAGAETLMNWSLAQEASRVVVKRPVKAPPLGPRSPSHSLAGKTVRFDVYVL